MGESFFDDHVIKELDLNLMKIDARLRKRFLAGPGAGAGSP